MDKSETIYTVGLWSVKLGNEAAFIAAWEAFAKWASDNQPGAMEGRLLQDLDQPQRFVSFGPWKDAQSIQAWRQQPEFKAFLAKVKELCDDIQPRTLKSVAYAPGRSSVQQLGPNLLFQTQGLDTDIIYSQSITERRC